ncbi:MAG TPA: NAD(P)H-binding protein [Vicinamibacteria bacterium]|nr:NAD(P)H-binding protein [Vicinamibacteria bacterium]
MRVALTGATGFTGRRVAAELARRGHEIQALVRPPLARAAFLPAAARRVAGDMGERGALDALLEGAEGFVHVASLGFGHADGVVDAVDARRVPRGLYFSSTAVFTRLESRSRAERARAEERVRRSAGAWTLLRPTMIYGDAGDRNLSRLIRFLARTPCVPLPGGGRALVQPVHVDDLARAAVDALECPRAHRREYDLPGAAAGPLRALVEHVLSLLGRRPVILSLPIGPAALAARLWHALGLPPRVSEEQVRRLAEDKAFSYEDARRDWGYAPRGWREGLAEEVETLRREGWIR